MICLKCGKEIADNSQFCPNCGNMMSAVAVNKAPAVTVSTPAEPVADLKPEKPKKERSGNHGKAIAFGAVALVVIAAIVASVFFFFNGKGYEKEVKAYLDFYAEKEDDAIGFVTDGYMGGSFGNVLNGKKADEITKMICKATYESNFEDEYDNWKEYVEANINAIYDMAEDDFGDWKMTYEIKKSKKLSKSKIKDLEDVLEEIIEGYEEILDEADLSSDDEDELEDYIEKIEDAKIKAAYEVKVQIKFKGDYGSFKETYDFKVAKIGGDWVILEGPSVYQFMEDAKDIEPEYDSDEYILEEESDDSYDFFTEEEYYDDEDYYYEEDYYDEDYLY